jgi:preprotein translocase subunit YajC
MNTKKIIAIISLIVLIGGVVVFALWIKNKPTKEQKAFANKFAQDMQEAKNGSLSGTVTEITGEKIVLSSVAKKRTELKINTATPVAFMNKEKKLTKGQIADVKAGDLIDLKYDRDTMNVVLIIEFKSQ